MSDREERLGRNEAAFRQLNEQIEWLSGDERRLTIVCECGELACDERLTVTQVAYEKVRSEGTDFLIVPGHEIRDVEDVIVRGDGYTVVRKKGIPADVAEQMDPRA